MVWIEGHTACPNKRSQDHITTRNVHEMWVWNISVEINSWNIWRGVVTLWLYVPLADFLMSGIKVLHVFDVNFSTEPTLYNALLSKQNRTSQVPYPNPKQQSNSMFESWKSNTKFFLAMFIPFIQWIVLHGLCPKRCVGLKALQSP